MVFLSTYTTKAAIFMLLTLFSGTKPLIYIGLFMMAHGILYAMLENDIRRLLSYVTLSPNGHDARGYRAWLDTCTEWGRRPCFQPRHLLLLVGDGHGRGDAPERWQK